MPPSSTHPYPERPVIAACAACGVTAIYLCEVATLGAVRICCCAELEANKGRITCEHTCQSNEECILAAHADHHPGLCGQHMTVAIGTVSTDKALTVVLQ